MSEKTKITAFLGLCTGIALILAYIEVLLPPLFPGIPGIKMGLPNVIIIFLLYKSGARYAFAVSLVRIILAGLLFGNFASIAYSFAGGILSLAVMALLKRLDILSVVGVSVSGGVVHNLGQILMAILLLETAEIGYYLAVLTVFGTVAGIIIGLCGRILIKNFPKSRL